MKQLGRFAALAVVLVAFQAFATEVLVLTTSTQVDASASRNRKGFEIQNLGANPLYCELNGGTPVSTKSRKVGVGESWAADAPFGQTVNCLTSVNQTTGVATIYSEVKGG